MSGQDEAEDKDWRRKHWGWVLGIGGAAVVVVFVVLSIDPSVRLHEQVRGLAQWAQPLAGFTPLLIGAVAAAALVVGYRNFRVARRSLEQRQTADDRAEWWRRVQSAIDLVTAKDRKFSASGSQLLRSLLRDRKISPEEADLLEELTDSLEEGLAASIEEDEPESQTFLERLSKGRIGPSTKQE
ncbi:MULTISPECIES: hypothetical protein [Kocuria]|uniref:hypothetical protein n=1 Tax=Kocuria TaxID=57493 RepID=UPI00068C8419|nr:MULTISPECIES: hypothetical protein [Kocuria]NHU86335.1 hypothetical protein [Kocuria sp. JC486]